MSVLIAVGVCIACYFLGRILQWFEDAKSAMGRNQQVRGRARR
ncbi:MAG TPA: hypothetical protein VFN97_21470 [Actinospica sp.]|nr:hypothetical protein [Actinospica sp.]